MTEEEAKTKWCPFVRATRAMDAISPAHNRVCFAEAGQMMVNTNPDFSHCIGSACMAWRWKFITLEVDVPAGYTESIISDTEGHCGLAGSE